MEIVDRIYMKIGNPELLVSPLLSLGREVILSFFLMSAVGCVQKNLHFETNN